MNTPQFIQIIVDDLHRGFRAEVENLTQEQLVYRPSSEANSIAFVLWHFTRGEDNTLHRQLHNEAPLWEWEEWYQRLGMQPSDTGNGFNAEQVGAFRPPKEDLLAYCQRIWEVAPALLDGLTEADLDRAPNPERPQMTLGRSLANFVIGHGFWHLGDIRFIKGLQGMPFSR